MPSSSRKRTFLLLLLATAFLLGCDPGYIYRPVGWAPRTELTRVYSVGGITLETSGLLTLIGSEVVGVELTIANGSADPLVLESASLTTKGQTFEDPFLSAKDLTWTTVPSGESRNVITSFELGGPAFETLGTDLELKLVFGNGPRRLPLVIALQRER